jgi:hypothetical protein
MYTRFDGCYGVPILVCQTSEWWFFCRRGSISFICVLAYVNVGCRVPSTNTQANGDLTNVVAFGIYSLNVELN